MANNIKPYKVHSKRRRNQTLLVQAGLGVLIVALLFGISYSSVKIIHGQPVFPVRGAQQDGGQPSSESTPPAPESVSTPSGGGAQEVGGRPEAAAPVQAWNTEVPVERTLESDVTASDSRHHNCTCIIPQKTYLCNANYIINTYININDPYNFHLHMPCFSNTYCHRLYNNDYHHTSFTQGTKATAKRE